MYLFQLFLYKDHFLSLNFLGLLALNVNLTKFLQVCLSDRNVCALIDFDNENESLDVIICDSKFDKLKLQ